MRILQTEDRLEQILRMHIVQDSLGRGQLADMVRGIQTLAGTIDVVARDDSLMLNDARIAGSAVRAGNGVIYPIDRVLVPEDIAKQLQSRE